MDLSLSNEFDESFLTDWGDGGNKVELPGANMNNRETSFSDKKEGSEKLGGSNFHKDSSSAMKNQGEKNNSVQNNDQNGGHQITPYLTSLMEGNTNMSLPQSPPFWQSISMNQGNRSSGTSDGVNLVGNNVTQGIPSMHPGSIQWNQQEPSLRRAVVPSQKQGQQILTNHHPNNESSSTEKNTSLHTGQSNAATSIAQHQSQHILQQSQQGNPLINSNLWQSNEMKSAQPQPQQQQGQVSTGQQTQAGQAAIQQVLYQSAALAMMKGHANPKNNNITGLNTSVVPKNPQAKKSQIQPQSNGLGPNNPTNIQQPQQGHPPFHLFGPPCELRYNFIQSQKKHDLPIWQDNNSYHYGMAINGFHPQLNAMENPPVLIDARHINGKVNGKGGDDASQQAKSCKERNEKEQRRAQKISDLIDKLRLSMVQGGWKKEMKSKFQTLSTCKEYVKHLIKVTQEKEKAVEKAKSDLNKTQQLHEDKAAYEAASESRSDPESVMSSLTSSSRCNSSASIDDKDSKASNNENSESRKRKHHCSEDERVGKARLNYEKVKNDSTSGDSSEEEMNRCFSSSSDRQSAISTTDKSTSSNGSETEKTPEHDLNKIQDSDLSEKAKPDELFSSGSSCDMPNVPKTMEKFELDYEEVFMTSNVPQVIASSAGRIIKCNRFFLKAVGLSEQEVRFLTIFSIVQADQLSFLFETVGNALRKVSSVSTANTPDEELTSTDSDENKNENDYMKESNGSHNTAFSLLTLPCSPFPTKVRRNQSRKDEGSPNKFYMTISLLNDQDPQKCLFHCLLNNFSESERSAGYTTAKLVDALSQETNSVLPQKSKTPVY